MCSVVITQLCLLFHARFAVCWFCSWLGYVFLYFYLFVLYFKSSVSSVTFDVFQSTHCIFHRTTFYRVLSI